MRLYINIKGPDAHIVTLEWHAKTCKHQPSKNLEDKDQDKHK